MNSQFSFIRQCTLHTYYVPGTVLDNEDTPGSKTQSLLSSVPPVHSFIHSLPHKHSFVLTLLQSLVYSAVPVISGRTWGMLQASVLFLEPRSRLCYNLCCLQSLTAASSCLMPYLCPQSSGPSRQADRQTIELHSPACSPICFSPEALWQHRWRSLASQLPPLQTGLISARFSMVQSPIRRKKGHDLDTPSPSPHPWDSHMPLTLAVPAALGKRGCVERPLGYPLTQP